jgi:hypothetical protein
MVFPNSNPSQPQSAAVTALQTLYGAPSQAGFGSAVFDEIIEPGTDLEPIALRYYQHFVGKLWEQFGADAWMSTWKQVYARTGGITPDIVAELQAIADPLAAQYIPILLLADTDNGDKAQKALAVVYNDSQVTDLRIYMIGDGAAMSGLLLAGCRTTGETTILVSLLD